MLATSACGGGGGGGKAEVDSSTSGIGNEDGGIDSGAEDPEPEPDTGTGTDVPEDPDAGLADVECEPKGCRDLGYDCGEAPDGCGGTLICGTCKGGLSCGGGGKEFVCGCTPRTCESAGAKTCGTIPDGCGKMLDCGNPCTGSDTCGGNSVPNQCGCARNLNACAGKSCGTASDGCGGTLQCGENAGMCSGSLTCDATQSCACGVVDTAAFCVGKCGAQQTPDGCPVACPACAATCAAGPVACTSCACPAGPLAGAEDDSICRNGTCCAPEPVATTCGAATCGTRVNNCGQTVSCGTCGAGLTCSSQALCETPAAAALVGKYAARSVGFGAALGIVTRAEGLLLVDVYRDATGKLVMREQACWSGAYSTKSMRINPPPAPLTTVEYMISEVAAPVSKNLPPTTIELDLSASMDLRGPEEWLRPLQPADQNTGGWRRGRPSYCPADGSPLDPVTAPEAGPRALGARKPWLPTGTACLCPVQELDKRNPQLMAAGKPTFCAGLTGAAKATCADQWAQNELPYQPGRASVISDVTDCRIVDDDLDGKPGVTADVDVVAFGLPGHAIVQSASVTANRFWGKIDQSGAKQHWGVSQDQPALKSSAIACGDITGAGAVLCSTSSGDLCPGYAAGATYTKDNRVNPIDFVPLDGVQAPAGGWTCEALFARRSQWFPDGAWLSRYPSASICSPSGN